MVLSIDREEEFTGTGAFIISLPPRLETVLRILAERGLTHKEVAKLICTTPRAVEKAVTSITQRYRAFFASTEPDATFSRIRSRAYCYYFLQDQPDDKSPD